MELALEELTECVPAVYSVEDQVETAQLAQAINAFLHTLPERECNVFLRRYWYAEEYSEIAKRYRMKLGTVKTVLYRTRQKLRSYLEEQGLYE